MISFRKYFQLVCEVTVEQVKTRFESKAWKRAIEQYALVGVPPQDRHNVDLEEESRSAQELILSIVPNDIDDNSKGNALNWLISLFIKEPASAHNTQWPEQPNSFLELFYQIKQQKPGFLAKKAIEQIEDESELYEIVKRAKPAYDAYLKDKAERDTRTDISQSKVFENEEFNVYVPKTKGAAIQLGKGTDWCTAAPGLQYYEHYVKTSPLVIFINKQNPEIKYQFWYNGTESQFMNPRDEDILHGEESDMFFQLNELVKQFADKFPQLAESNNYEYKLLENGGYMLRTPKKTVYYDKNKELHREDGPARKVNIDGATAEEYYIHGRLSRKNDPAKIITDDNGTKTYCWILDGTPYREDNNPTTISINDNRHTKTELYEDTRGMYHRDNGPAIIRYQNDKVSEMYWYTNGKLNRLDGPAVINSLGLKNYYINNIQFTKEEFYDEKARERKLHDYF